MPASTRFTRVFTPFSDDQTGVLNTRRAHALNAGEEVRVVNERDAVVFYIRAHCGRRGAYSAPERPRLASAPA